MTTLTAHPKLVQLRLEQLELEMRVEEARERLAALEAAKAGIDNQVKLAVFKSIAGYSIDDTPAEPRSSAYFMEDPRGRAAFAAAVERWERWQMLNAVGPFL